MLKLVLIIIILLINGILLFEYIKTKDYYCEFFLRINMILGFTILIFKIFEFPFYYLYYGNKFSQFLLISLYILLLFSIIIKNYIDLKGFVFLKSCLLISFLLYPFSIYVFFKIFNNTNLNICMSLLIIITIFICISLTIYENWYINKKNNEKK